MAIKSFILNPFRSLAGGKALGIGIVFLIIIIPYYL